MYVATHSFPPLPALGVLCCFRYWMSRDQRVSDNWALLKAVELARQSASYVCVCFTLVPSAHLSEVMGARHTGFMLRGLTQVQDKLKRNNVRKGGSEWWWVDVY